MVVSRDCLLVIVIFVTSGWLALAAYTTAARVMVFTSTITNINDQLNSY
jgi:hypothetical protein